MMSVESFIEKTNQVIDMWFCSMILFHIMFIVFFIAVHKLSNAISFYQMIKKGLFIQRGWGYAKANITKNENDAIELSYYLTETGRCVHPISGFAADDFSDGDTVEILYRESKPDEYVYFDTDHWRDRIFVAALCAIVSMIIWLVILFKYGISGVLLFWVGAIPYMIGG